VLLLASTCRALENARHGGSSRPTLRCFEKSRAALQADRLDEALRYLDRAWRSTPEDSEELVSIYGRLLLLEARDHDAALRLLQRVATPDADISALTALALLHLERGDEAQQTLKLALADFCLLPDGLLAHIASEILHHPTTRAAGWIGRGSSLEFMGELIAAEPANSLNIRLDSGAEFIQPIKASLQNGRHTFHFKLPQVSSDATLEVTSRGAPLIGSGCRAAPRFGLDGRASSSERNVHGWVRLNWLAPQPVSLRIEDERGQRLETKTHKLARSDFRWHFSIDLRRFKIPSSRIQISALLPDGDWQPLPDMPLLLDKAVRLPGGRKPLLTRWRPDTTIQSQRRIIPKRAGIDVIIPVYRGCRETLTCIDAVLATAAQARIVVVDDATDDRTLAAALDELEAAGRIALLRNTANLGFVGSVNRALARNRTRDAVLLNSDAVVFGDWLGRLQDAAYSAPHVGTVTPFSNSGSIASYPRASEDSMSIEDAAALHRLAGTTHAGVSTDIPVGVGFCLYVRRDCLNQVGELNASVFGKGYGEETDFCLRARHHGWSHRLAADVFVYHAGGRSFGVRREALLHRSQRLLNLRHPGFDRFIADFLAKDPLGALRRGLDEHRLSAFPGRFVLLVTLALTGGVARFVAERCRAIRAQGLFPLVLRPHEAGNSRRCELWTDALDVPNLQYDIPSDLAALAAVLRGLSFDAIEIQHFLHVDARVIEAVRGLGVPYDIVVHDYAWICPRVTLIDGSGRYCGEPSVNVCESCVKRNGSELGEKISVSALRRRSAAWLGQASRVIAPSADAAARLKRYFNVDIVVQAHAISAVPGRLRAPRSSPVAIIRVALIGAIGDHKGYRVLLNCARDAQTRCLPLEFIVIGYTQNDAPLLRTGKVFITGRYGEGEASHLLRRERPDIAFMPSVWPETWCYALDDALAAQLPVVAFDLGAIAERLRAGGVGTLLPLNATSQGINDKLLELAAQTPLAQRRDTDIMRKPEEKNMNNPAVGVSPQQDALSASVQILPLSPGLYLFSVKAAAASLNKANGQLQLPAMHVGLGPGVRSSQVEFIAGPVTDGAWLFAKEDCLVTKVNGAGATLVLTSVRGPGGETLSIKVERLDARAEAAPAVLPPIAPPAVAPVPTLTPKTSNGHAKAAPASKDKPGEIAAAVDAVPLPMQISTHIRTRGDMTFSEVPWAGRVAPGLWIESFSIKPLARFESQDIEYKALTGSGFETPWLSDATMCGTKGMSVPLVGFAIRLKPSRDAVAFDCEYSGYFKSGVTVGPSRNGAPCRSTVANDPLEGIQVHIRKRSSVAPPAIHSQGAGKAHKVEAPAPIKVGPSFGRYRGTNGHGASAVAAPASKASTLKSKLLSKPAAKSVGKSNSGAPHNKRSSDHRS
jgi:GT2 family glycosyltransferase/glycosyltransferase involved in cell wall biosynthesis